jgi:signal transduction histidine kinase
MLQNLDTIYNLTRNISIENSNINTGVQFNQQLKDMLFGFNTTSTNVIINNIDAIAWATLADEYKITVYRVLQELLVNMKKHSNCSLAVVSFANDEKTIIIKYADNGIGANLVNAPTKNGLHNIENRLRALKGSITFTTELNKGFKADIILPV